jgi:exopolysaccharide production protein ExoQ
MDKQPPPFPVLPDMRAIPLVALTLAIMAYSSLFNILPILFFLGIWLSHLFYKKSFILRPSADMILALLLPLLCCYSFFWSDYPGKTIYTGLEFTAMAACTIIMARIVSTEAFAKGIALGAVLVLLPTLLSEHYAKDYFSETYALVGFFGSKNQVGFIAQVGIFISVIILFMKTEARQKIFFGFLPLLLCCVCFFLSRSASSAISLTVMFGAAAGMYVLTRAPRAFRPIALGTAILAACALAVFVIALDLDILDKILAAFGKNSTLTGRTYLWAEGIKIGQEDLILGHGYAAFWVPGQHQAEQYWHEFQIYNKTGFHFHNLLIQTFVDLGAVGLTVVSFLLLTSFYKSLRLAMVNGMPPEAGIALGLSCMFLIRAFVEVDWLGPFGIGPLLFFWIIPHLAARRRASIAGGTA